MENNNKNRSRIEAAAWLVASFLLGLGVLFTTIIMTAQSTAEKINRQVVQNRAFICAVVQESIAEDGVEDHPILKQAMDEHCVRFNLDNNEDE